MKSANIIRVVVLPEWNYSISPKALALAQWFPEGRKRTPDDFGSETSAITRCAQTSAPAEGDRHRISQFRCTCPARFGPWLEMVLASLENHLGQDIRGACADIIGFGKTASIVVLVENAVAAASYVPSRIQSGCDSRLPLQPGAPNPRRHHRRSKLLAPYAPVSSCGTVF